MTFEPPTSRKASTASYEALSALCLFKVLADETRLRILGLLAIEERTMHELSSALHLHTPILRHHLGKLSAADVVRVRAAKAAHIHYYALDDAFPSRFFRDLAAPQQVDDRAKRASLAPELAWEHRVIGELFNGERLKEIPMMKRNRQVVPRWLVERFEFGSSYTEAEVNAVLLRHHEDFAYWRKDLVGAQLLARDHGRYWRLPTLPDDVAPPTIVAPDPR